MENITGNIVNLKASNQRHFGFAPTPKGNRDFVTEFGNSVNKSLRDVNKLQVHADKLGQKRMLKPESVNITDLMIAAQKAQLSLNLTKNIIQKSIQAYKSLTGIR